MHPLGQIAYPLGISPKWVNRLYFAILWPVERVVPICLNRAYCLNCTNFVRFRLGLRPRPRWGSLYRSQDLLAGFKGAYILLRGGEGRGGEDERAGEGTGRERGGGKG